MAMAGGGSIPLGQIALDDEYPVLEKELEKCKIFLKRAKGYQRQLQEVANRVSNSVTIHLDDFEELTGNVAAMDDLDDNGRVSPLSFDWRDLAQCVIRNTMRYIRIFAQAIDEEIPPPSLDISDLMDVKDILASHRSTEMEEMEAARGGVDFSEEMFYTSPPPELTRRFQCFVAPSNKAPIFPLRQIRAKNIGQLVRLKAMVTRAGEVKPRAVVVAYTCEVCNGETYQKVVSQTAFTPHKDCQGRCKRDKVPGRLFLQTRACTFVNTQKLRVQELPEQVPVGCVPTTMAVRCEGAMTRQVAPGDIVTIGGIFLPQRQTGFKGLKAGLLADTFIMAQNFFKHKKGYEEIDLSPAMEKKIDEMASDPDIFGKIARSIAPEIYGHEDIKRSLLLQLVGGPSRTLSDGMKIRGDINICLMGDPGVAKSQLLKHISSVAPRGVYTTGKGSSGVGLTACVTRDSSTGDMMLEGGALVLADKGICCIDEFDKMDDFDRTAIHEVMEQQTVSIAKAGITTTLNARAAILAAANPLWGRYNTKRSLSENVNLPNSLISRFDLIFLVLDRADMEQDVALARHVTHVHQHLKNPDLGFTPVDPVVMKHYISMARMMNPHIPRELTNYIVEAYVALRSGGMQMTGSGRPPSSFRDKKSDQTVITARQLLSILRLSQALARLRFVSVVTSDEVDEAIRLTHMSKASLLDDRVSDFIHEDVTSRVYGILRDYAAARGLHCIDYSVAEAMVIKRGFKADQLHTCLEEYTSLDVLHINADRTQISFAWNDDTC